MTTPQFRCMLCQGEKGSEFYRACPDYYLRKPFVVDYYRCDSCSLVQQSPIPADVTPFYDQYPVHAKKSLVHDLMRRLIMAPVYFRLNRLPKGTVLLDYGCGDGWFLQAHAGRGYSLLGFEPGVAHAQRLADLLKLPIYGDMDELIARHAGTVDIVTMHFVLEHVTDLDQTFANVRKLLKPGGRFYFVVPDVLSLESKLFKKKWHGLDPPRHISFPEKSATRELAGRHGLGLTRTHAVPFPNGFAGSMPVLFAGHFTFILFLLFLPLGVLFSRLAPTGARAYWLEAT